MASGYISGMVWTFPNILTILRLLAAPLLGLIFLLAPRPYADFIALILFVGAALTDYLDGYLARAWRQESKLGAMLDPIADKAMVIIALIVVASLNGTAAVVMLPTIIIVFREVFVSGLREFLGDVAGTLKVTKIAKWKTTVQMIAIVFLFAVGVFEHYLVMQSFGMAPEMIQAVLDGQAEDLFGLRWKKIAMDFAWNGGLLLLWIAAGLTLVSGIDYFRKAWPHLQGAKP